MIKNAFYLIRFCNIMCSTDTHVQYQEHTVPTISFCFSFFLFFVSLSEAFSFGRYISFFIISDQQTYCQIRLCISIHSLNSANQPFLPSKTVGNYTVSTFSKCVPLFVSPLTRWLVFQSCRSFSWFFGQIFYTLSTFLSQRMEQCNNRRGTISKSSNLEKQLYQPEF